MIIPLEQRALDSVASDSREVARPPMSRMDGEAGEDVGSQARGSALSILKCTWPQRVVRLNNRQNSQDFRPRAMPLGLSRPRC